MIYKYILVILYDSTPILANFYELPKLHKKDFPLRPIVSFCGSPSYRISKYLARILRPYSKKLYHTVNNSSNVIDSLKEFTRDNIPSLEYELVSFDVKALYTSIPKNLAIEAVKNVLSSYPEITNQLPISMDTIVELINLCFDTTCFSVNGSFYRQIDGTPMGSHISSLFADFTMHMIESDITAQLGRYLHLWRRYVDDVLAIISKDKASYILIQP